MTLSKSIVYGGREAIVITNQAGIVEIINPSFTENLGFKPDQILGRDIAHIFAQDFQSKVKAQIDLMQEGQVSPFWEEHVKLINDFNDVIPFHATLIAMKSSETSNNIDSFVLILSNELEEEKKREEAEIAKAKSEKLLYQILPKDIVCRLNRGEKDISFTIPQATVFFIDIVKFSNYAASLSPSDIMANLSLVFATFDKNVSKYETITKIKLIGDVYMAAAGLFLTAEEQSSKHAEESVLCCVDCLKSMEEINATLESSLEVRIGVNTGGPLIGGVLGTDKPTFDIIGDPINIAARLQSTDIPGNIQVSEETKKLVEHLDLVIEERGQVYLKGKGNRVTYLVKPINKNIQSSFVMLSSQLQ